MPLPPHRRPIRLPQAAYRAGDTFLLTCCVHRRETAFLHPPLARHALHCAVQSAVLTSAQLWAAVIMPDHVHLLVSGAVGCSVLDTGACFKRLVSWYATSAGRSTPLWQRRIHDQGIRTHLPNALDNAIAYLVNNPVRAGFTTHWSNWPFTHVAVEKLGGSLWTQPVDNCAKPDVPSAPTVSPGSC